MSGWEQRSRQRRPHAVVWLLAIALGATAVATQLRGTASQPLPVAADRAPVVGNHEELLRVAAVAPRAAGDRWVCPSTHPVAVHDGSGTFVPVGYPERHRPAARPARCYADERTARGADYRRAPPPPGAVVVDGVYFEPARAPSRADCRTTAAQVGFAVPCPRLLPTPAYGRPCPVDWCVYRNRRGAGVVIEQWHATSRLALSGDVDRAVIITGVRVRPPGPPGRGAAAGPRSLAVCRSNQQRFRSMAPGLTACDAGEPWVSRLDGGAPHAQRMAVFWRRDDISYAASVPLHTLHADTLLRAIIRGIDYVPPP